MSESVICSGIVSPLEAASARGDVKLGLDDSYVFSGLAYCCGILAHIIGPMLWVRNGILENAHPGRRNIVVNAKVTRNEPEPC